MCDFRIIEEIQLNDGTIVTINNIKDILPSDIQKPANLFEPGFYCVCMTGSWHVYNDGENWLTECAEYSWHWPNTRYGFTVTKFHEHLH